MPEDGGAKLGHRQRSVMAPVETVHQMVHIFLGHPEHAMQIPITEAKAHLTELVRRAEAGDEIVLTRHGKATVRLVPVVPAVPRVRRRAVMDAARQSAAARVTAGPDAARSQDFLYDDDGLPA